MECRDAGPMIAAAADGALDRARQAALDAHVATCSACRAALADQRLVRTLLASLPPAPSSPDFLARVNARIDAAAGWFGLTDFRAWTLRLAPVAAALALVAFLAVPTTPATETSPAKASSATVSFSPASLDDWQRDVTADALLDAALTKTAGEAHVR